MTPTEQAVERVGGHTPGPWSLKPGDAPGFKTVSGGIGVYAPARRTDDFFILQIASMETNLKGREVEANATLIASAPDLLAALTLAEDVLSRFPFTSEIWPDGTHPNAGIEQIRAALSRATGGAG